MYRNATLRPNLARRMNQQGNQALVASANDRVRQAATRQTNQPALAGLNAADANHATWQRPSGRSRVTDRCIGRPTAAADRPHR
jgi:hypothetical protein